jgi:hypothetical protein
LSFGPADALDLVRRVRVMTLTTSPGLASVVEAVAGGPIRGSWWGHPAGNEIFRVATALEDHADVLAAKLVGGRVAFVHRALWPAVYRVVSDAGWRKGAAKGLDEEARELLRAVERAGELRPPAGAAKARRAIEARGLVLSASEHTEKGSHATVLRSWKHWAPADVVKVAGKLGFEAALAEARGAGLTL